MKSNENIGKYKMLSLLGILVMGIGSFISCLATSSAWINIGTVLLCFSLVLSVIGFSKWQP